MKNISGSLSEVCMKCGRTILCPSTPEMPGAPNYYYGYCYSCWAFMSEYEKMEAKRNFMSSF